MLKIAAVVTLFHPDKTTINNIESYISIVEKIYIVINSELSMDFNSALSKIEKIEILYKGTNIGIAKALNMALIQAEKEQYSWLLTMDQDSFFTENTLTTFFSSFQKIDKKNLILFSPLHNKKFIQIDKKELIEEKSYVMTSGNLVNITAALNIGAYDENLFIDEIDHEFCFRALNHNFFIKQDISVSLTHQLGLAHTRYSNIKLYPPIRIYYMIRNYLYIRKKYLKNQTEFFKERDFYLFKFIIKQLLYGENKIKKLKMLYLGIKDYTNQKFGRYNYE